MCYSFANMNILILRVSAIGDVIHTLPALFYLKKSLPRAKISWVVQKKASSILENQKYIDRLYVLPNKFLQIKNWGKTKKIIVQLRAQKWDAIIDFQGLCKTSFLAWWVHGKKFGFDRANTREPLSAWFTHHHTKPIYTNIIQKNLSLASSVISYFTPTKTCPTLHELQKEFDLFIPQEKKERVQAWLDRHAIDNFITLAPNTTWASKHWPLENWHELIHLLTKANMKTILLGKDFGAQAAQLAPSLAHHVPAWDLLTVAHLLKKTDLLIAPDTGILHLADFLKTKIIGLFGPTLATKHGPFLTKENIANAIQIPCTHRYKKCHKNSDCMSALSAKILFTRASSVRLR